MAAALMFKRKYENSGKTLGLNPAALI